MGVAHERIWVAPEPQAGLDCDALIHFHFVKLLTPIIGANKSHQKLYKHQSSMSVSTQKAIDTNQATQASNTLVV